jgi:ankyrin repeat protein
MLKHGADPEQPGAWPPARAIIIATFVGEPEYIKRLKNAGTTLGDRKVVEKALRKQPGFAREREPQGLTALQCAAGSRLPGAAILDIPRLLLDAGADVRARTKSWDHDVDAVYLAAGAKNKKLFELLLERGADPDRAVAGNQPLLNNLIRWGQIRQSLWLLDRGANPNLADDRGWTAVHQAASRGNTRHCARRWPY